MYIHISVSPFMEQSSACHRGAMHSRQDLVLASGFQQINTVLKRSVGDIMVTHRVQSNLSFYTIRRAKYDTRSHVGQILKPVIKLSKSRYRCCVSINCTTSTQIYDICSSLFLTISLSLHSSSTITR